MGLPGGYFSLRIQELVISYNSIYNDRRGPPWRSIQTSVFPCLQAGSRSPGGGGRLLG